MNPVIKISISEYEGRDETWRSGIGDPVKALKTLSGVLDKLVPEAVTALENAGWPNRDDVLKIFLKAIRLECSKKEVKQHHCTF